jgi:hypothetical protein
VQKTIKIKPKSTLIIAFFPHKPGARESLRVPVFSGIFVRFSSVSQSQNTPLSTNFALIIIIIIINHSFIHEIPEIGTNSEQRVVNLGEIGGQKNGDKNATPRDETSCFNSSCDSSCDGKLQRRKATTSCFNRVATTSCDGKLRRQVSTNLRPSWEIKLGNKLRVKSSKLREDALVGEAAAEALEHRARRKVLARDELDALKLPPPLGLDKPGDRGVNTRERIGQGRSRHF